MTLGVDDIYFKTDKVTNYRAKEVLLYLYRKHCNWSQSLDENVELHWLFFFLRTV